jgi:uncharacterized NAD(P)/FAD-binding protein YdhS
MVIAIVGGGAAGAITAISILRQPSVQPRRVVVVEPSTRLGDGVAYGTQNASHLLNVRVSGMSAIADEPGHFLAWARRHGIAESGDEFVPRLHYGRYLRDTLLSAVASAPLSTTFEHRRATVTAVRPVERGDQLTPTFDDGTELRADHVVLATGNTFAPPAWLPDHPGAVADPWRPGAVEALRDVRSVLIGGTGLTAVDTVLTMRASGFRGTVHLVSTHGLFPASHSDTPLPSWRAAITPPDGQPLTARALVRGMRADATLATDWRQAVDSIRPLTVELWRGLPLKERKRFLRHASRQWEVSRHRMAPQVAAAIADLRAAGRLTSERGRIAGVEPVGKSLRVTTIHAGQAKTRDVDAVISCIGPTSDPQSRPLLASMLDSGVAVRHPLGIGLDVNSVGAIRRPDGSAWPTLWAVGPLRKGAEWESTAIPEIRAQARDLAADLLRQQTIPPWLGSLEIWAS